MSNKNIEQKKNYKVSDILGEAVWVLLNSPSHKLSFFLADLDWFLIPAIRNGNYKIYKDKESNDPVALLLWAKVSDEINEKLKLGISKLAPHEWNSGENYWIIELIVPKGDGAIILEDFKNTNFKGINFAYNTINNEGKNETVEITAE